MSATRSVLAVAAVGAAALLLLSAGEPSVADPGLEQQLGDLRQRVAALETELTAIKNSVRSNHPDPSLERTAQVKLAGIQQLIAGGDAEEARPQLAAFLEEYGNTRTGQKGRAIERELAAIGKPAPEAWTIDRWYQGENELDLHGDGPTMVVFWETWCPHCRREVPALQETYERYGDQGLQILALTRLTRGSTDETVREFIDQNGLGFPIAKENGILSSHFAVAGIPAAAVVMDGEVIWRGHPALISDQLIESWLQ